MRLKAKAAKDQDIIATTLVKEAQKLNEAMWAEETGPLEKMSTWCLISEDVCDAAENDPAKVHRPSFTHAKTSFANEGM